MRLMTANLPSFAILYVVVYFCILVYSSIVPSKNQDDEKINKYQRR